MRCMILIFLLFINSPDIITQRRNSRFSRQQCPIFDFPQEIAALVNSVRAYAFQHCVKTVRMLWSDELIRTLPRFCPALRAFSNIPRNSSRKNKKQAIGHSLLPENVFSINSSTTFNSPAPPAALPKSESACPVRIIPQPDAAVPPHPFRRIRLSSLFSGRYSLRESTDQNSLPLLI